MKRSEIKKELTKMIDKMDQMIESENLNELERNEIQKAKEIIDDTSIWLRYSKDFNREELR